MQLVLLGSPGAGKGTQGELLAKHFQIPRIATGDMFRAALASDSPLGKAARSYVERGELVPDDITIRIVQERLTQRDCERGFVLDGFPRTVAQAVALDEMLAEMGRPLHAAIYLQVPLEVAVQRLSMRRICSECGKAFTVDQLRASGGRCPECGGMPTQRSDDSEQTVRHRLAVYEQATRPVIDYYRERELLLTVNGLQTITEVFDEIRRGLDARASREVVPRARRVGTDGG